MMIISTGHTTWIFVKRLLI